MPHPPEDALRTPRVYVPVLAITLAVAAFSAVHGDAVMGPVEWALLILSVGLLGIPHGAVDHLVARDAYGLDTGWRDGARFYGFYLLTMLLYAVVWVLLPIPALVAFLAISIYHFGQSDLADVAPAGPSRLALYVSRGLLLIGVLIFAHVPVVAPVLQAIAGAEIMALLNAVGSGLAVAAACAGQHALVLGLFAWRGGWPRRVWAREAASASALTALFFLAHPLVAFAVYFGLWHSLGHVLETLRFFNRRGRGLSVAGFYRQAAPFTLVSFAGLAGLYVLGGAFGLEARMLALLFILISVLTLPHVVVVEAFYRRHRSEGAEAAA